MKHSDRIAKAAAFAAEKHQGQVRKSRQQTPYINHLEEVAKLVAQFGGNEETIIAAWLHDVVEDCPPTSIADIAEVFGERVALLVAEVTDDKSLPKAQRKRLQVETADKKSLEASLIKLADKIANVRELGVSPPMSWDDERRVTYLEWSIEVVANLSHKPPAAIEMFEHICIETRERLE